MPPIKRTESVAVGSKEYEGAIKEKLGALFLRRRIEGRDGNTSFANLRFLAIMLEIPSHGRETILLSFPIFLKPTFWG